jgi:hypothetical protein
MKTSTATFFLAGLSAAASLLHAQTPLSPRSSENDVEYLAEVAYAGRAGIAAGSQALGDIDSLQVRLNAVRTLPIDAGSAWLLGIGAERFEFNPPAGQPIPDRLAAYTLKLGYNRQLDPRWALRAKLDPGLYGAEGAGGSGAFNIPTTLGLGYARSREVQWFFGVNVDPRAAYPVVGVGGVRWQLAGAWTLQAMFPESRIEYAASRDLTLFAAATLSTATYRVAQDFGRRHGRTDLDNQQVSYRELNAGVGLRYRLTPAVALAVTAGWMLDRRFEFRDRHLLLNGAGAPSAQVTLSGAF